MMQTKLFEVRDRATTIPCIGTLMATGKNPWVPKDQDPKMWTPPEAEAEAWLLRRAGYGTEGPPYLVLFSRLGPNPEEVQYDPYKWSDLRKNIRTIPEAHRYISEHWDELESGAVIDVEFILGETAAPKASDRLY